MCKILQKLLCSVSKWLLFAQSRAWVYSGVAPQKLLVPFVR